MPPPRPDVDADRRTAGRRRALIALGGLLTVVGVLSVILVVVAARTSRLSAVERRLVGRWEPVDPPGTPATAAVAGSYVLTFRDDGTAVRTGTSDVTEWFWHIDGDRLYVRQERPLLERVQTLSWREEWESMPFKEVSRDEIVLGSLVHRRVRIAEPTQSPRK